MNKGNYKLSIKGEFIPVEFFRIRDLDKTSRQIRDPLRDKFRIVFTKDLPLFGSNAAAREAGLITGQLYRDGDGTILKVESLTGEASDLPPDGDPDVTAPYD